MLFRSGTGELIKAALDQEMQSGNTKIYSNIYIDVLNKNDNKGFSLDENGNVAFSTKVSPETFLYESINKYVFEDD